MSGERLIPVLGQQIRVNVRVGTGVPLVLCNGIGASVEVLDPLVARLDPDTTVVRFDVPGAGRFAGFTVALRLSLPGCRTRSSPDKDRHPRPG
jgi:hypothetical protein